MFKVQLICTILLFSQLNDFLLFHLEQYVYFVWSWAGRDVTVRVGREVCHTWDKVRYALLYNYVKSKRSYKKEKRQIEIFPGTKSYITIFEAHKCCTGLLLSILESKLNTTISNYCTLLKNNILRTYLYTRLTF